MDRFLNILVKMILINIIFEDFIILAFKTFDGEA